MLIIYLIAYLGFVNAFFNEDTFNNNIGKGENAHRQGKELIKSIKATGTLRVPETRISRDLELWDNRNFWFKVELYLGGDCQGEAFRSQAIRVSGCTTVDDYSYYLSCAQNVSSVNVVYSVYASTDCTGPIQFTGMEEEERVGCQVDDNPAFRARYSCVNADMGVETENGDYGSFQYFDTVCSEDPMNVHRAKVWHGANDCVAFDFTTLGLPPAVKSGKVGNCGERTSFYTGLDCQAADLLMTIPKSYIYSCHVDHHTDDDGDDDDAYDGLGSMQHFCVGRMENSTVPSLMPSGRTGGRYIEGFCFFSPDSEGVVQKTCPYKGTKRHFLTTQSPPAV